MKLQVLLSAMHLNSYKFIDTLNITGDCIVINQCNNEKLYDINDKDRSVRFISTKERGLSRSRNMALANATADICILCDNDVEYVDGYEKIILEAFENNPEYQILIFYIKRITAPNPLFIKPKRMGVMSIGKIGSPQIAFRRDFVKNISFKTEFGAGSKYSMGEESIFLHECLRKGFKIKYIPTKIANLREEESTWFKGFTEKYFFDRGACFLATSNYNNFICILKIWAFAILKYKKYKNDSSLMTAVKNMFKGKNQHRNEYKKR